MAIAHTTYLTPPAVAKRLGIGVDKVRAWIERGDLIAVNTGERIRPRWRISEEDLQTFLRSRSNRALVDRGPGRPRASQPTKSYF